MVSIFVDIDLMRCLQNVFGLNHHRVFIVIQTKIGSVVRCPVRWELNKIYGLVQMPNAYPAETDIQRGISLLIYILFYIGVHCCVPRPLNVFVDENVARLYEI